MRRFVPKAKKILNFLEGKPKVLRVLNEENSLELRRGIKTIACRTPAVGPNKFPSLIVPNGLSVDVGLLCKLSDCERLLVHTLEVTPYT